MLTLYPVLFSSQAHGAGSLLSFLTGSVTLSKHVVETTKYFSIAVSFGKYILTLINIIVLNNLSSDSLTLLTKMQSWFPCLSYYFLEVHHCWFGIPLS